MSFFDTIVKADSFNKLPFIEPGEYLLRLDSSEKIISKQGKGEFVILEFSVLEAAEGSTNQAGTSVACRYSMTSTTGPGNAKSALLAVLGTLRGEKQSALVATDVEVCFGPDAAVLGQKVRVSADLRPKKNTPGSNYTHVNWFPVL